MSGSFDDGDDDAPDGDAHDGDARDNSAPRPFDGPYSLFSQLGDVCAAVVRLTGVDGAAIALFTGPSGGRDLLHATDSVALHIDETQFTLGEGPCLEVSAGNGAAQLIPDTSASWVVDRWPVLATELAALAVAALFTFPVMIRDRPAGVLQLYRCLAGTLDERERAAAQRCAEGVARTIVGNWDIVSDALELTITDGGSAEDFAVDQEAAELSPYTRAHVHIAAGMVAVQLSVSTSEALLRLRGHAYRHTRSVTDVADDVIARRLHLDDDRHNRQPGG